MKAALALMLAFLLTGCGGKSPVGPDPTGRDPGQPETCNSPTPGACQNSNSNLVDPATNQGRIYTETKESYVRLWNATHDDWKTVRIPESCFRLEIRGLYPAPGIVPSLGQETILTGNSTVCPNVPSDISKYRISVTFEHLNRNLGPVGMAPGVTNEQDWGTSIHFDNNVYYASGAAWVRAHWTLISGDEVLTPSEDPNDFGRTLSVLIPTWNQ